MAEKFRLKKSSAKASNKLKLSVPKVKINKVWQNRVLGYDESLTVTNAIINSIGEGVIMVDEYGSISHVNQPAIDILGFARDEMEGKWLQEVLPQFDRDGKPVPADERLLAHALATGTPAADTINFQHKGGRLVPVFNTSSPFIVKGKPMGGILIFRDVSKEIQIERAKDEFVSLASHQLRTPLTSVRFFSELLKDQAYGKLSKKQVNYLDKIRFSTERMISLVSELLNISRLNLGQLEIRPVPTNINNLLQNILIEVGPLANSSGIKLVFDSRVKSSEMILADRTLLAQVVNNLITNAIRYSRPGKTGSEVKLSLRKKKNDYEIAVSDNGIGIPGSADQRIYERFFRAENAIKVHSEGTGLGLYLVKFITETAGGKTWYKSKAGSGTTFYITIPLQGMQAAAPQPSGLETSQ